MDRREFLTGLFGLATAAALPNAAALSQPVTLDWEAAILNLQRQYLYEIVAFGTCMIRHTDVFPFVEIIPASEWHV